MSAVDGRIDEKNGVCRGEPVVRGIRVLVSQISYALAGGAIRQ